MTLQGLSKAAAALKTEPKIDAKPPRTAGSLVEVLKSTGVKRGAAGEANGHAAQYPLKALRGRPDEYVKGALRLGLACAKAGNVVLRGLSGDAAAEAAKQTCSVHWQGHVVGQTGPLDGASGHWEELNSFGINI